MRLVLCFLVWGIGSQNAFALIQDRDRVMTKTIGSAEIMQWGFGLIFVLFLFFACIWVLKKLNGFSVNPGKKIQILESLTLGMREKIVLLKAGDKQVVLAITPGKIEKLLVLRNEDQLQERADTQVINQNAFEKELKRAINDASDV